MALSMHRASVPVFVRGLKALSGLLTKAQAQGEAKGVAPEQILTARLAPDMLDLVAQIQRVSDTSKLSGARLSGVAAPPMADEEKTFEELQSRIARTVEYLESLDPAAFEGAESRTVPMKFGPQEIAFRGDDYLFNFALPNFYFHVAIAHGILRNQGVEVGKRDFLGA